MWNERQLDTTPFLREYERLLLTFANDYKEVRHENVTTGIIEDFFQSSFSRKTFENVQVFDFEGLKGRMLSASYMPSEADRTYDEMIVSLRQLFEKHKTRGKISILYDTNIFYTQF
jgi:replication initiation and membrane attachment protein DnaB